jgi:hypothetical protein
MVDFYALEYSVAIGAVGVETVVAPVVVVEMNEGGASSSIFIDASGKMIGQADTGDQFEIIAGGVD